MSLHLTLYETFSEWDSNPQTCNRGKNVLTTEPPPFGPLSSLLFKASLIASLVIGIVLIFR